MSLAFIVVITNQVNTGVCDFSGPDIQCNRGVHTLRGIMGNQSKLTKKQSCKTNVFLYFHSDLVTKHTQ